MWKPRIIALIILVIGLLIGYFVYESEGPFINQDPVIEGEEVVEELPVKKIQRDRFKFHLGLDLQGGTHLVYNADVSEVAESDIDDSIEALRDVIERRVNLFGVSEPVVQTETSKLGGEGKEYRLIVELPGVTDIEQAVDMIGQTPLLEFRTVNPDFDPEQFSNLTPDENGNIDLSGFEEPYQVTELTGRYLRSARVEFSQSAASGGHGGGIPGQPYIAIQFDRDGGQLFREMTAANVGLPIAIYLDGTPISEPTVQQEIIGGEAVITGNFDADEAKLLAGRLNSGALPVAIALQSTQTIGPSLGATAVEAGIMAGVWGLALVALLLLLWYRLPGLLSVLALAIYSVAMLFVFKVLPVTLTAAGIAGFIISIGIAVDANILIFERMKEEIAAGRTTYDAIRVGFDRAWLSIRDANLSSLISAIILFWFGSSLIKGFALTFGLGVLVSMLSAITVTRYFLLALHQVGNTRVGRFLFGTGLMTVSQGQTTDPLLDETNQD